MSCARPLVRRVLLPFLPSWLTDCDTEFHRPRSAFGSLFEELMALYAYFGGGSASPVVTHPLQSGSSWTGIYKVWSKHLTISHSRAFLMATAFGPSQILEALRLLDQSSPDFPRELSEILDGTAYRQNMESPEGNELASLVSYLEEVRH